MTSHFSTHVGSMLIAQPNIDHQSSSMHSNAPQPESVILKAEFAIDPRINEHVEDIGYFPLSNFVEIQILDADRGDLLYVGEGWCESANRKKAWIAKDFTIYQHPIHGLHRFLSFDYEDHTSGAFNCKEHHRLRVVVVGWEEEYPDLWYVLVVRNAAMRGWVEKNCCRIHLRAQIQPPRDECVEHAEDGQCQKASDDQELNEMSKVETDQKEQPTTMTAPCAASSTVPPIVDVLKSDADEMPPGLSMAQMWGDDPSSKRKEDQRSSKVALIASL